MEAAELGGEGNWQISVWLFLGVFMVVLIERHMGGEAAADHAAAASQPSADSGH
jgi:hypothetical protein